MLVTDREILLDEFLGIVREVHHCIEAELPIVILEIGLVIHCKILYNLIKYFVLVQSEPGVGVDIVGGVRCSNIEVQLLKVFYEVKRSIGINVIVPNPRESIIIVHLHLIIQLVSIQITGPPPGQREPQPQLIINMQILVLPSQFLLHFHIALFQCGHSEINCDVVVVAEIPFEDVSGELVETNPVLSGD